MSVARRRLHGIDRTVLATRCRVDLVGYKASVARSRLSGLSRIRGVGYTLQVTLCRLHAVGYTLSVTWRRLHRVGDKMSATWRRLHGVDYMASFTRLRLHGAGYWALVPRRRLLHGIWCVRYRIHKLLLVSRYCSFLYKVCAGRLEPVRYMASVSRYTLSVTRVTTSLFLRYFDGFDFTASVPRHWFPTFDVTLLVTQCRFHVSVSFFVLRRRVQVSVVPRRFYGFGYIALVSRCRLHRVGLTVSFSRFRLHGGSFMAASVTRHR